MAAGAVKMQGRSSTSYLAEGTTTSQLAGSPPRIGRETKIPETEGVLLSKTRAILTVECVRRQKSLLSRSRHFEILRRSERDFSSSSPLLPLLVPSLYHFCFLVGFFPPSFLSPRLTAVILSFQRLDSPSSRI